MDCKHKQLNPFIADYLVGYAENVYAFVIQPRNKI
jgi:hypothetical protein